MNPLGDLGTSIRLDADPLASRQRTSADSGGFHLAVPWRSAGVDSVVTTQTVSMAAGAKSGLVGEIAYCTWWLGGLMLD